MISRNAAQEHKFKDKLIDKDNRLVVTREKEDGESEIGKGGVIYGNRWNLEFWW